MKADPILEELWQIKDELSREMVADPAAYLAKLDDMTNAEERAGRKIIHSAAELQQLVTEMEHHRAETSAMVLNDRPQARRNR